ncbi:MAG: hypothetical protein JSV58_04805 [Candidatus Bathyarchaeota archaeon]|nr:MAG: hypothetical protein JSV58_04805 [Candidatus Bathyarchaeota archaeon]
MEQVFEKYGWGIYLALGLLWVVVGLNQAFLPDGLAENEVQRVLNISWSELEASSPITINLIRFMYGGLGLLKVSWSFLVLAITVTGYRKGEKWAWYTLWLVPGLLVSSALFNAIFLGDVFQMLEFIPILSISLLGLLLPYKKYFPR